MTFSNQITLFEDAANQLFETVKTYKTVSQFTGRESLYKLLYSLFKLNFDQ